MTNLSKISQDEVSENQVRRSIVAKTQQLDAERLSSVFFFYHYIIKVGRSDPYEKKTNGIG